MGFRHAARSSLSTGTGIRRSPLFFLDGCRKRRRRRSGSVADATPKPHKSADGDFAVSAGMRPHRVPQQCICTVLQYSPWQWSGVEWIGAFRPVCWKPCLHFQGTPHGYALTDQRQQVAALPSPECPAHCEWRSPLQVALEGDDGSDERERVAALLKF